LKIWSDDNPNWILMGGFAIASNPTEATALATSGAGGCQIIIVHKGPGRGALGHYAGHNDAHWIVRGVSQMIRVLGGHPVADVVFAAGDIGVGATQQKYQQTILDWVRVQCPGARVSWPAWWPLGSGVLPSAHRGDCSFREPTRRRRMGRRGRSRCPIRDQNT